MTKSKFWTYYGILIKSSSTPIQFKTEIDSTYSIYRGSGMSSPVICVVWFGFNFLEGKVTRVWIPPATVFASIGEGVRSLSASISLSSLTGQR